MTTTIISSIALAVAAYSLYLLLKHCKSSDNTDQLLSANNSIAELSNEFKNLRDFVRREAEANELSHGELALEIQELSKLKKTDDIRAEVLKSATPKTRRKKKDAED